MASLSWLEDLIKRQKALSDEIYRFALNTFIADAHARDLKSMSLDASEIARALAPLLEPVDAAPDPRKGGGEEPSKAAHLASIHVAFDWEGDVQFRVDADKPGDNEAFKVALDMIHRWMGPSAQGGMSITHTLADGSTETVEYSL